ncbi:hypothetical protein H2200_004260 [Cladophialophora chaetospira]|uniref:HTH araC/xylS-type domain-containing protein n=1 Tax=Cladophialophora chaetospira TaxID=386627 RepID=A0AA38XDH1_9EURO|nr:hypothetical protein H2200_004260 [Cladophialophora chaetospira]
MTTPAFSTAQARWSAIVARNPEAREAFVYAVKTTGIYCRPDCKARLARQANIVFYDNGPQAEEAGYRPCKRCRPELLETQQEDPLYAKISHAVRLVEESASRGEKISLADLSSQVGLSKWHLQRVFSRLVGLSPNQLSTSIINTIESESRGSPQAIAVQSDNDVPASTPVGQSGPQPDASWDAQEFENIDWNWEESETAGVDDVLKDLFPELYSETSE